MLEADSANMCLLNIQPFDQLLADQLPADTVEDDI